MTQRWKEIDTYVKEWIKEAGQKFNSRLVKNFSFKRNRIQMI